MKFQQMLLTRMRKSLPKVKILSSVAHVKYLYIYIISKCEIYMITVYILSIYNIKTVQRLQYCMILFHVSESNA